MSELAVGENLSRRLTTGLDLGLALALPLSTQVYRLAGLGQTEDERIREAEGPITPARGAFAIWAPIFVSLVAHGVQKATTSGAIHDRFAGNCLRASLVGNILWNLNAQLKGFGWQSVALIGGSALTATASVARLERLGASDRNAGLAAGLIAPLAGWLSAAAFANIDTTQRVTQTGSRSRLAPQSILALATASVASGLVATKANPVYTMAAGWGLGGIVVKNRRRDRRLALSAMAGLLAITALSIVVRRGR